MLLNKYTLAMETLKEGKEFTMKVYGNSMTPILTSGVELTYRSTEDYQIGDVVLTKVKGRWIDAHKITSIDSEGRYMISNNKGHDNGWTKKIYGRVVKADGKPFGRPI